MTDRTALDVLGGVVAQFTDPQTDDAMIDSEIVGEAHALLAELRTALDSGAAVALDDTGALVVVAIGLVGALP